MHQPRRRTSNSELRTGSDAALRRSYPEDVPFSEAWQTIAHDAPVVAERHGAPWDRVERFMADLYVVFDGDECIGLAATLADATIVAQAGTPGGAPLGIEWTPATPHGWVLLGTAYRALLQPVTNTTRIQLTPTPVPGTERDRSSSARALRALQDLFRRLRRSVSRETASTIPHECSSLFMGPGSRLVAFRSASASSRFA